MIAKHMNYLKIKLVVDVYEHLNLTDYFALVS